MTKEVTSKENRIIGTTIMLFIIGFFTGSMPEISILLIIFNCSLAILSGLVFLNIWKKTKHDSKRYFSLFSYVMFNCIAIYFAIPFLRLNFLTISFWLGIIMLLLMVTLPYIYSREILFGVKKPNRSKLGKIYLIFSILVVVFGSSLFRDSMYSDGNPMGVSIYTFMAACILLFLAPIMLINPNEEKERKRVRN
ncbi:hypothetical protein MUN88_06540 [Gracilibacillus caseinilyticus]|uniref:DUF308 domain-containing protein n=1 Tax=Gracilibacillus caseinilyticus TaxID=2932256 RepID=A0ABY4EZ99_9BACI|nr:hypothetical protein [Gracilibacillus caseinilyticus]UOQ49732.1 hypothetical protein MUN88_06540 [Gracilibacillus caseinilyticus]